MEFGILLNCALVATLAVKNFIQGRFEGRVKIVSFGPFEFAATCKKGRLHCLLFFDPVGKGNYLILVLINT